MVILFLMSDVEPLTLPAHAGHVRSRGWEADGHPAGERGADAPRGGPDLPALPPGALLPEEGHPPPVVAAASRCCHWLPATSPGSHPLAGGASTLVDADADDNVTHV